MIIGRKRLEEIRERCEKASKGPWVAKINDHEGADWLLAEMELDKHDRDRISWRDHELNVLVCSKSPEGPVGHAIENAELMAHSREDTPDLLSDLTEVLGALGFYADRDNWDEGVDDHGEPNGRFTVWREGDDGGARARAVVGERENGSN